jgi:hypothetical protein
MDKEAHDFFSIDRLQSKHLTYIRTETANCVPERFTDHLAYVSHSLPHSHNINYGCT